MSRFTAMERQTATCWAGYLATLRNRRTNARSEKIYRAGTVRNRRFERADCRGGGAQGQAPAGQAPPGQRAGGRGQRQDGPPPVTGLTVTGEVQNFVPVTDAVLRNPDPGDW